MKTVTLALLFAVSPAVMAQVHTPAAVKIKVSPLLESKKEMAAERLLWLPAHDIVYVADGESAWRKSLDIYYTYDSRGNVLSQITDDGEQKTKVVCTYDGKGQLLTETTYRTDPGSSEYKPRMKKEYAYDPEIFDLATSFDFSTIKNGEWQRFVGSCYRRTVERNADGLVTSVTKSVLADNDTYYDQLQSRFAYKPGQKAPETYEYLTSSGGQLVSSARYVDLKWARTSGGYLGAFSTNWFMNGNFLESATIKDSSYGDLLLTATDKGGGSFEIVQKYASDAYKAQMERQSYNSLDDYGSFTYTDFIYYNLNGDAATDADLYQGTITDVRFDSHGNVTLSEDRTVSQAGVENAAMSDGVKNEYVYGGTHGELTQTTTWEYDYAEKAYALASKTVHEDFVNVATGISAVTRGDAAGAAVFNLQGARVGTSADALPHGVYIVGGKKIVR